MESMKGFVTFEDKKYPFSFSVNGFISDSSKIGVSLFLYPTIL